MWSEVARHGPTPRIGRCDHSRTRAGFGIQSGTEREYIVTSLFQIVRSRALAVLMLGHFCNDMLGGVLPVLFPTMKLQYGLTNAQLGLVILAFTATSSLTQPLFGYFSDTHGRRWFVPATLIWGALCAACYGFITSYLAFIALAALAGIGSGAFHPLGASNAAAVSNDEHRNAAMSFYTVAGGIGYGLGPIVGSLLLGAFGPRGTLGLLGPGFTAAALIWPQMRLVERAREAKAVATRAMRANSEWRALSRVILVTMLRSWVFLSVLQMSPIWYSELGFSQAFYGSLAAAIILAGAAGTLCGGGFADRIGQRRVIVATLLLTIPALLLYVAFPGPQGLFLAALFGFFCDASLSVTLVMAQRLVPGRIGVASGVILGLGFVTGGIGVPITGRIADLFGMQVALASLTVLLAIGSLVALTIPTGRTTARESTVDSAASRVDTPAASAARR
jgi:FSR family fosmidomycin resistance protein-like MFS transporter